MKQLIVGFDVSRSSITVCFLLEKPLNPRDDYYSADIETYNANLENLNKLKAKIESFNADRVVAICEPTGINYARLWLNKLSERRFMRAVGMGVVREDSGKKKKGKQSGSALCRKALWQWCFTRLEVSKAKPALEFNYGEGDESVKRSPSEDLKIRRAGGTPIKLARQRVIARCIRELFKELSAIAIDTTDE
jgi:hypothetical protein